MDSNKASQYLARIRAEDAAERKRIINLIPKKQAYMTKEVQKIEEAKKKILYSRGEQFMKEIKKALDIDKASIERREYPKAVTELLKDSERVSYLSAESKKAVLKLLDSLKQASARIRNQEKISSIENNLESLKKEKVQIEDIEPKLEEIKKMSAKEFEALADAFEKRISELKRQIESSESKTKEVSDSVNFQLDKVNKKIDSLVIPKIHSELKEINADDHHKEKHDIESHINLIATTDDLNQLVSGKNCDKLHNHREIMKALKSAGPIYAPLASSGSTVQYWQRAGTVLSPTTAGDDINMGAGGDITCIDLKATTLTGTNATKGGTESISFGATCNASGNYSIAVGQNNTAAGTHCSAFGRDNNAGVSGANYCVAMGYDNDAGTGAGDHYAIAMGYLNTVLDIGGICLGYSNTTDGSSDYAVAIGYDNSATTDYALSMGYSNEAAGDGDISIGYDNYTAATNGVTIGSSCNNTAQSGVAIGASITISGLYAVAIGYLASAVANSVGIGRSANATGTESMAAGNSAIAAGAQTAAFGRAISNYGYQCFSAGYSHTNFNYLTSTIGSSDIDFMSRPGNTIVFGNTYILDRGTLGTEKITNGTFTGGTGSWTLGTGWAYGTNNVTKTIAGTGTLSQTSAAMATPLVAGETYKLVFKYTGLSAGEMTVTCAGVTITKIVYGTSSAGTTITTYFTALNTNDLVFTPTDAFRITTLDDVSLKKIIGTTCNLRVGNNLTIGNGLAATDYTITFDGESNDGLLTWMEDEDYLKFSDDILMDTTERAYFRDTNIYIASLNDGYLDLEADTAVRINADTTIDGVVTMTNQSRARAYATSNQTFAAAEYTKVELAAETFDSQAEFDSSVKTGTTSAALANHLFDDVANQFTAADVGKTVWNTTDNTYATITAFDGVSQLGLSADIFVGGEGYRIYFSRYTAKTAGYYQVNCAVEFDDPTDANQYQVLIYKNGAVNSRTDGHSASTNHLGVCNSDVIYLAATDYLELYIFTTVAGITVGASTCTYLSAHKIS